MIASVNDAGPRVEEMMAYPNPTQGAGDLRLPGLGMVRNATITITNTIGAVVHGHGKRMNVSIFPHYRQACIAARWSTKEDRFMRGS